MRKQQKQQKQIETEIETSDVHVIVVRSGHSLGPGRSQNWILGDIRILILNAAFG